MRRPFLAFLLFAGVIAGYGSAFHRLASHATGGGSWCHLQGEAAAPAP